MSPKYAAMGAGGLASGLLGTGCAACGSLLLNPFLAFIGAGGIVAALPFGGQEFAAAGMALLGLSLLLACRNVHRLTGCALPAKAQTDSLARGAAIVTVVALLAAIALNAFIGGTTRALTPAALQFFREIGR